MTAGTKAAVGAVVFGSAGGLVGIPFGAAVGSKYTYRFETPAPPPVVAKNTAH